MNWKIAEAKQRFSELVKAAEVEPQWIYNRDTLVAAMVPPESLQAFQDWLKQKEIRTVGDAFEELRRVCEQEGYTLDLPPRRDRPNPLPDALDELAR